MWEKEPERLAVHPGTITVDKPASRAAQADLRIRLHDFDLRSQFVRSPYVIIIEDAQKLAFADLDPPIERAVGAQILFVELQVNRDAVRSPLHPLMEPIASPVFGAVVETDNLKISIRLSDASLEALG